MTVATPTRKLELLAPAKTAAIGREAILHGADAVYIGGPAFGARDKAGNSMAEIAELVAFAHRFHARIFVTLNTILHDAELETARDLARSCWDAGVDALIVQDLGLLELDLPPIDLHASTQCDIRTPEKARFLASAGFSQIVLARELTLAEIAAVRALVPADTVIEHFIHGALCVAYSGQCYISHAQTGRSANRGDCSQACRLPYTLQDRAGQVVAFEQHLLSLKDNNQSANLAALIDAGVTSFKIEGRYKDAPYVKNVTGHYRRLLDAILEQRADLAPASCGRTKLFFTPDPERTFHRGATDYFSRGRQPDIGAFATPTYVGLDVGTVTRLGADWIEIEATVPLINGDGLAYLHKRQAVGFRANRAERLCGVAPAAAAAGTGATAPLKGNSASEPGRAAEAQAYRWRVWPNEPVAELPGLRPGQRISRSFDQAWEQTLARPSAERKIDVEARFTETPTGFALTLIDADGITAGAEIALEHQPAQRVDEADAALRAQLDRFGQTDFVLTSLTIDWTRPWFVPSSAANRLRRDAVAALGQARLAALVRPLRRAETAPSLPYPEDTLSYLANVYNQAARGFYARHGVTAIAAAFEAHEEAGEVSLMITRHCLRYSFSLCPKQAKGVVGVQGQVRAEPMTLASGDDRLTLRFDCARCEMHVLGRARKGILASPPPVAVPAVAPITVHRRSSGPGAKARQR